MNAHLQGKFAAQNMAGGHKPFELVSSYATNLQGVEIIFIGDANNRFTEQMIRQDPSSTGGVKQFFIRDNRIVEATLIN
jgi:NAD(P)H-nitrite reductase large subunit